MSQLEALTNIVLQITKTRFPHFHTFMDMVFQDVTGMQSYAERNWWQGCSAQQQVKAAKLYAKARKEFIEAWETEQAFKLLKESVRE